MSKELAIDGKNVEIIEYKGTRVISAKVVADFHNLEVRIINQKFQRNRKYFHECKDYFKVSTELLRSQGVITISSMDRSEFTYLFTISGYLNYIKTINDDRAWAIFEQLKESYFEIKGIMASQPTLLADSKKNRSGITSTWSNHGDRNYGSLTVAEYSGVFGDIKKRKSDMDANELALLSAFEYIEGLKLNNNPQIHGDGEIKESIKETSSGLLSLVAPRNKD